MNIVYFINMYFLKIEYSLLTHENNHGSLIHKSVKEKLFLNMQNV